MDRFRFSKTRIEALNPPTTGRLEYADTETPGLKLRLTSAGVRTFFVMKRMPGAGSATRVTLGRYPDIGIETARRKALEALSLLSQGMNPNHQKKHERAKVLTLRQLYGDYLAVKNLKASTRADYIRSQTYSFSDWLDRPITGITEHDVLARHERDGKKSKARANQSMRVLRALFNFARAYYKDAQGMPLYQRNPVDILTTLDRWYRIHRRKRIVRRSDLADWFRALMSLGDHQIGHNNARDGLLLLLFTGLRISECFGARIDQINTRHRTITLPDPKNGIPVEIPLNEPAWTIVANRLERFDREDFLFPSYGKAGHFTDPRSAIEAIRAASGVEFTCHDLRRTFKTTAEALRLPTYTQKRLMNHVVGTDVSEGYTDLELDVLRGASEEVASHITKEIRYDWHNWPSNGDE